MPALKLSRLPTGAPEVFTSLQGEGVSLGVPSTFVRLAYCNLRCRWCDTAYTWDWAHYDPGREVVERAVDEVVREVVARGVANVVITGGEPLLQQAALVPLTRALHIADHRIEVETNGTLIPDAALAPLVDQWNVSPKLANAGNLPRTCEVAPALRWYVGHANAFFKFVIVEPGDLDEVAGLASRYAVPTERILVMPEGRTPERLAERSAWLAAACQPRGYRFTPRLHILLWGDQRGR